MLGVDTHQTQDLSRLCGQELQGSLDRFDEQDEFRKVAIMGGFGFDFLPKVLDRIVVGRVGRQLVDGQTFFVLLEKFTSGFAGVVTSAVLDEDDRASDLRKQITQKGLVAIRLKALFGSLINQATAEEFDGAKDLVAFAQPAGWDLWLASSASPGIGQGPPQGEAGFVAKEQRGAFLLRLLQNS